MSADGDDDVEEMSYRERITKAKELRELAAASSGDALDAAAHLRQALRYLFDVDEDSPKEAQMLRAAILEASAQLFEQHGAAVQETQAETRTSLCAARYSAAQTAHVLRQACPPTGPGDELDVAPPVLENLAHCFAEEAGACDFLDAGGLPPLLHLCSRQIPSSSQALHAMHAFSARSSMVPAMCSAGAQAVQNSSDCLWWLRRTVRPAAEPSERVLGLKIISNMSDIRGLDAKQQDLVHSALRNALVRRVCTLSDGASSSVQQKAGDLIQELEKLLSSIASDEGCINDFQLALVLCTCVRNLARDAETRPHFECLMPLLLRVCVLSQSAFRTGRAPQTELALGATTAQMDPEHSQSLLLVALEALINIMSGCPSNRAALLNSSESIFCHFTGARWGIGLKNLQTPLVLTKVETGSEAAMCGLVPGDIIVRIGEHVDYGDSLPLLQQSLRQGGSAEVQLQRTGVVVLAGDDSEQMCPRGNVHPPCCLRATFGSALTMAEAACLDDRNSMDIREAAACALGCLSSFYEPGQLSLVRSGAVKMLLAALSLETPPAVTSAIADAVANSALAPANHARLVELGAVSGALWVRADLCCPLLCLWFLPRIGARAG